MILPQGHHLAYCTNIHPGETWAEVFASLQSHALAVRQQVAPGRPFALGLRLGARAVRDLEDARERLAFRRWLDLNQCYIFTLNGFPYGQFHQTRVKEDVYRPDWTTPERLEYTNRLFELLAEFLPPGIPGSVSTLPGSFKEFHPSPEARALMRRHLWSAVTHVARLSEQTGRDLHLGIEPEPLCLIETTTETASLFDRIRAEHPGDPRIDQHLGVNYDTCHMAVEFEEPGEALDRLLAHGIRISKIHLSSALKVRPTAETRAALKAFTDPVYLHQTVIRQADGQRFIYRDLPDALARHPVADSAAGDAGEEWRIHYHIPLHAPAAPPLENTTDHLLGVLDRLQQTPGLCAHLEMETYTWDVLPAELKSQTVTEQLVQEYTWTLERLAERGLA